MDSSSYRSALETLRSAAAAYYHGSDLLLADHEYDKLLRDVAAYEAEHGLTSDVTSRVAAGTSADGADHRHATPMLSLANAMHGTGELDAWLARGAADTIYAVEPKLDGLAASATYVAGRLTTVATRGDGITGEDVTSRAANVAGLPTHLGVDIDIEIRGEIVLTESDFEEANRLREANGDTPFANPRNGAAGALRGAAGRSYDIPMTFGAYGVAGDQFTSHADAMEAIAGWGVTTARHLCGFTPATFTGVDAVTSEIGRIEQQRFQLPVAIDGAVVKLDDMSAYSGLGATSKAPRWAIAYKYAPQEVASTLVAIDLQVGRTGVITPVAVIEPVDVAGVTVTRTTVSNPTQVAVKGLRVGAKVLVRRAGDVIPEICGVIRDDQYDALDEWKPPTVCPNCAAPLTYESIRVRCSSGGTCVNSTRIEYAVSRKCYDIEGLSGQTIDALLDAGLINDFADLYSLSVDDLLPVDRMGARKAQNLVDAIAASTDQPLDRFLTSLGIETFGTTLSRRVTAVYTTLDEVLALSVEDLAAIDGIGLSRAESIVAGLTDRRPLIDKMVAAGLRTTADVIEVTGDLPLVGKKVVVTGTVPGLGRDEAKVAVERLGGTPASSVSKATDLLVVGSGAGGSKVAKAEQFGVATMSADEFLTLLDSL